ncbi:MAG: O-antigen ligase family protein [Steroidobacteraceae bacterium]
MEIGPVRPMPLMDHYASTRRPAARSTPSSFGLFGWSVAAMIWVGIGRVTEFIPLLRGLPLGKIAVVLALTAYWARGSRRSGFPPLLSTPLGRNAALLAAIGLVSITFSIWRSQTLHEIGECTAIAAEFWLVYTASSTWRNARLLLGHVAAASGALALTAAAQYTGGRAEVHSGYDTNDLAYVLVVVLPLAYAGAVTAKGWNRLLWASLCGAFVIAVLLTASRGGVVGLVVVVLGLVFSADTRLAPAGKPRASRRTALIALLCLIVFCTLCWRILPAETRGRMQTFAHLDTDYNMQRGHDSRLDIWIRSASSLVKRPIGFGLGTFQAVDGMTGGQYRAPHNSEVQIGVELGFLGLWLYLRMYLLSWRVLRRVSLPPATVTAGVETDDQKRIFAANLRISLLGNFTAGFFLSQAYSNLIWILFALIAAMALAQTPAPRVIERRA